MRVGPVQPARGGPCRRRMEAGSAFEALCAAARSGDLPRLQQLLDAAAELAAAADSSGQTPLLHAADAWQAGAVLLLEAALRSAAISAKSLPGDAKGELPLYRLAAWADEGLMRRALAAAPGAASAECWRGCPLHVAAESGNRGAVRVLLDRGAGCCQLPSILALSPPEYALGCRKRPVCAAPRCLHDGSGAHTDCTCVSLGFP